MTEHTNGLDFSIDGLAGGSAAERDLGEGGDEGGDFKALLSKPTVRSAGQFQTATRVDVKRNIVERAKSLCAEAILAGESFYYGWGAGKDRVIGPSIGLAMAAARTWGNCAVDFAPVQDGGDSWIFTAIFIDLESGFNLTRQFRQSKNWSIQGKFDQERKDDMRFQIGQSKAARNVVTNALPRWMIDEAVRKAQGGVRARIENFIEKKGIAAAQDLCVSQLAKEGVTEAAILAKCQVATVAGLSVENVVMLRGDLYALQTGQDRAESLFPSLTGGRSLGRGAAPQGGAGQQQSAADRAVEAAESRKSRTVVSEADKVEAERIAAEELAEAAAKADAAKADAAKAAAAKAAAVVPVVVPVADDVGDADPFGSPSSVDDAEAVASANVTPTMAATNGGGLADAAWDYPPGFRAQLAACRSVGGCDEVYASHAPNSRSDEMTRQMQNAVVVRKGEIRAAARGVVDGGARR